MSGAAVRLDSVRFSFGAGEFFFNAEIGPGEIVAIMGPSGSGKSTLLNLVAGFEMPHAGRILIDGADVMALPPNRRPLSMVFQENNLFSHLHVAANVGLGRSAALKLDDSDRAAIAAALAQTGLQGKEKRLPGALSGGERQRAALARALVRDLPLLALDEPFASLGPALRGDMIELVRDLHARHGMTILMVSHHPDDARAIAGRVLFIEDGRIAADGPAAEILGKAPPPPVADYLGSASRHS